MAPFTIYRFDRTITKAVKTEIKGQHIPLNSAKIPTSASLKTNLQQALEDNMPISRFSRTLSEILSLSCKNLKTYTIDKVRHGAWGKPTNVTYHSQAQTLEDFQREMESMKIQFQREMESVKIQLDSLQAEREGQREVMKKWQAVNNIFQALCEMAWEQIFAKRKEDLATAEGIYVRDMLRGLMDHKGLWPQLIWCAPYPSIAP
ncbi:hypothetical protein BDR04DRAFT_1150652 [Suillus decipiens]|nr:hypothetical protein BDR04DRAFT_1150652 [Suillus decipiens]